MEDGLANLSIQCGQRVVEKVDLSLLIDQPEESMAYILIISTSQNNCFFIVPCKSHPLLLPARQVDPIFSNLSLVSSGHQL